jgi:hypothetical protein
MAGYLQRWRPASWGTGGREFKSPRSDHSQVSARMMALGLDAVGEPFLKAVLADGMARKMARPTLVILRDEIEPAVSDVPWAALWVKSCRNLRF